MNGSVPLNRVSVNGLDLHYLDAGNGSPLLLVHGGGATDYRSWLPVIEPFARAYRVVAPSLRYHYPNEWVGDGSDYSVNTHAGDMAALIEALELAPAHVIGHSLGATTVLVLARQRPELVRTLGLEEPAPFHWLMQTAPAEDIAAMLKRFERIRQLIAAGDTEQAVRLFADTVMTPGAFDRLPDTKRQSMLDNFRLLSLAEQIQHAESTFSREDARAIVVPTLLLRGDSSSQPLLLANDEVAKEMPGAERALIPRAAHLLHGMNPRAFADVVLAFLARH
jgi:pimeloyl-ACP methyl ester carboxylesterase